MTNNQKLRFLINEYWKLIEIDELYNQFKRHILKVKKGSEIAEVEKERLIWEFTYGIQEIEEWRIWVKEAQHIMLGRLENNI